MYTSRYTPKYLPTSTKYLQQSFSEKTLPPLSEKMSFFKDTPRYSALPRVSEDSERPSSDQDPLISRPPIEHDEVSPALNLSHQPLHIPPPSNHQSYPDFHDYSKGHFAIPLALIVRTLATMLCISTLICFTVQIHGPFIAAIVFLSLLIILNFFMAIFPSVLRAFRPSGFAITVEYRGQPLTKREVTTPHGPVVSIPTIIDLVLSLGLFLGAMVGNLEMPSWDRGPWRAGVVLAYIAV